MISVLIPTYNYNFNNLVNKIYPLLKKESIDFEIIVHDDNSQKYQYKLENNFNTDKIKLIKSTKNLGDTKSRQSLALQSEFNWLLFLDVDVIPKSDTFITSYLKSILKSEADLVFGGTTVQKQKPIKEQVLRWKYGKNRESHFKKGIISQAFLIKKSVFIKLNSKLNYNIYGLDNYFNYLLEKENIKIKYLTNPVIHFGLENTTKFLQKSTDTLDTQFMLSQLGVYPKNYSRVQKFAWNINILKLNKLISNLLTLLNPLLLKNLNSNNPNLYCLDLYKLNYYLKLLKS